ncbi:MAG: hypothetical protein LIP77_04055 [Planctomycetes bacterium]|nr:hypothetical protein [Planctomycetota bacterium]
MDTKPADNANKPASSGWDWVVLHARLVETLEHSCGRDALAARLSDLRKTGDGDKPIESLPAITRFLRRLGHLAPQDDANAYYVQMVQSLGEAVNRPLEYVNHLFTLLAAGDDATGVKPVCGATPQCQRCHLTRMCDTYNSPRRPELARLPPAERLMRGNDLSLSDAELLAVVLFGEKATGKEPVVATLLARYGRLRAMFRADGLEFLSVRDMSEGQALRLASFSALYARLQAEQRGEVLRITCAQDIHDRYWSELRDQRFEAAVLVMMDSQNNVLRDAWYCGDSPTLMTVAVVDLLRPAIREYAASVALVHNHPGNDLNPSVDDLEYTRRVRAACDILGLRFVDHVIVCEAGYYSFAEAEMMPQ